MNFTCMTRPLLITLILAGCAEHYESDADADEEVGTTEQELTGTAITVSPKDKKPNHTTSVASSDGPYSAVNWQSDVVVAYQTSSGQSAWAFSNDTGTSWTKPVQAWALPAGTASDGNPWFLYEGMPTVLGIKKEQTGFSNTARNFLYVTKMGSTVNGALLPGGTGFSTDVVVLLSEDGGATFRAPFQVTSGAGPNSTKRISFVTAATSKDAQNFEDQTITVVWREELVDTVTPANNYTKWRMRPVSLTTFVGPNNDALSGGTVIDLNGIPSTVTELSAEGNYSLPCVAFGTPNTGSCPGTGTQSMTWKYNCQPINTTYEETILTDTTWKQCVGNSSAAGGTSFNRNSSKPSLAFNRIPARAHVAVATGASSTDNFSRIRVLWRSGTGTSGGGTWSSEYLSNTSTISTANIYADRDSWMPALTVYQYPDTFGHVGVNFATTMSDSVSNARVGTKTAWWLDGNTGPSTPTNLDAGGPYVQEQTLGLYNGITGLPHIQEGLQHSFGDTQDGWTYVKTNRSSL